jgi:predicted PurR-regulated permease PerM
MIQRNLATTQKTHTPTTETTRQTPPPPPQIWPKGARWGLMLLAFLGFLYLLSDMLLPFFLAALLSYLLHPLVTSMGKIGLGRGAASILIMLSLLLLVSIATLFIMPIIIDQLHALIEHIPSLVAWFKESLGPKMHSLTSIITDEQVGKIAHVNKDVTTPLLGISKTVASNLVQSGRSILGAMGTMVITPIIAIYMLKDWPLILQSIEKLIPRKYHPIVVEQCKAVDRTLSRYIRGQLNASLVLGLFYGTALGLCRLQYGFTIGFLAGFLSFIPYFSLLVGTVCAGILAYIQFGLTLWFWIVIGIFLVGQIIEGNVVAPRLVGDKIGVHPLWMIFAVLAGGALFGFTGILIAVPTAAIIRVLGHFTITQYLGSDTYRSNAR